MPMGFGLHDAAVLNRNENGRLTCRERMSRLDRVTPAQHGECEQQFHLYGKIDELLEQSCIMWRMPYLLGTNSRLMGRESGDGNIGEWRIRGRIRKGCESSFTWTAPNR